MKYVLAALLAAGLASAAWAEAPAPAGPRTVEKTDLDGGLVREKIILDGWDPTDPVPAIAIYPKTAARLPLVVLCHWFRGSKEAMEGWARDLAPRGFFVLAPDLHLHGERGIQGVFARPDMPDLGEEFAVFVHQVSIAHSVRDYPYLLDGLRGRPEVDVGRAGVAGISMGGGVALVLGWQERRVEAVVSIVGACDGWWDVTKIPPGPRQDEKRASYSPRIRRLVESISPLPHADRYPPKALLMANGQKDGYIDIASVRPFAETLTKLYAATPERFRFIEEDCGHEATDTMRRAADEWLVRFLKPAPAAPAAGGDGAALEADARKAAAAARAKADEAAKAAAAAEAAAAMAAKEAAARKAAAAEAAKAAAVARQAAEAQGPDRR